MKSRRSKPPPILVLAGLIACGAAVQAAADTSSVEPPGRWSTDVLDHDAAWYASAAARALADSVIQYQSPQGGWPKSTNLAVPPRTPDDIPPPGRGRANSLDNDATTLPMEFLARVIHATGEEGCRAAFARGLDYLFAAQYPSGGWPQFWPLRGDKYYSRITYNDGAMTRVMTLLRDVADGDAPYAFVDAERRARAAAAVQRGIGCILQTQVKHGGRLTVWCAQHDEVDLRPRPARSYELESLSGAESAAILKLLMSFDNPNPAIQRAIRAGAAWYESAKITGIRVEELVGGDRVVVEDPDAPPIWARFYEIETNRPFFCGRDGIKRYRLSEIEAERRGGYRWYGNWGKDVAEAYDKWK